MIGAPTTLTNSIQPSHHCGPSYSINNDTASLQPVIAAFCTRQRIIFECCGSIGHKADKCIICGPKLLPSSLRRKLNHINYLYDEEPNEPPPEAPFKYRTSPPKTNPVVSDITSRLNSCANDNVNVEVQSSEFPV